MVDEEFKCRYCNKCLSSNQRLETHINICKENPKNKQVKCRFCDYTGRIDSVKRHEEN
jgi:hypothetical protein